MGDGWNLAAACSRVRKLSSIEQKSPLVLVTGPDKKLRFGWWATQFSLALQGLRAHYLTPAKFRIPENVRGVIIGGGDDIQPQHYGMTGDAAAHYDYERDRLELEVLRKVFEASVPVMGICRGSQLMNVSMGGNLHSDIRPLRNITPNRNSIFPIKTALIEPDKKLKTIIGKDSTRINSLHHQAIDKLGQSFVCCARDRDGFIQGIESVGQSFVLGVQWHPEYMPYARDQRRLFKAFADAVKTSQKTLDPGGRNIR